MSNYSAQGSISIKRLRNGDTLYLTLELNGKPLFQAVDSQTGEVRPSWKSASNQPVITPNVGSTRNNAVSLSGFAWSYNGNALHFTGSTDSAGFTADSTGKFAMDASTGALKIISDLASATNTANDTLSFSCVATVAGYEYNLTKSIDIQIQQAGASSYYGFINASTMQLNSNVDSVTLATELWLAASQVSNYYVKWYKGTTEMTANAGQSSIDVGRSNIDGSQLFIAEFYLKSTDTNYVFRAGISIIDSLDEIIVVPYISSSNKEIDTGKPVTVACRIVKASTGAALTPSNPSYSWQVMDGDTWKLLASGTESSISVGTEYTDQDDGSYHDLEVLIQVTFESLT